MAVASEPRVQLEGFAGAQRAARTSSTWPSTFTRWNTFWTFPRSSITNVVRSIPMNVFPYRFFSFHTPYAFRTFPSGSERSGKDREYFSRNFAWLARSSLLTPRTTAPFDWTRERLSRKEHASLVHPGVSSFG